MELKSAEDEDDESGLVPGSHDSVTYAGIGLITCVLCALCLCVGLQLIGGGHLVIRGVSYVPVLCV